MDMDEETHEKTFATVETTSISEQKPPIIEPPKQEIQNVREWHELFSEFFTKVYYFKF